MKTCWEILGIEITTDVSEIKKGYSKMISLYHPEDNQEEFIILQNAYKQALNYAKRQKNRNQPVTIVQKEEVVLYNLFHYLDDTTMEKQIENIIAQLEECIVNGIELNQIKDNFNHEAFKKYYLHPIMINEVIRLVQKYKESLSIESLELLESEYKKNGLISDDKSLAIVTQIRSIKDNEKDYKNIYLERMNEEYTKNEYIRELLLKVDSIEKKNSKRKVKEMEKLLKTIDLKSPDHRLELFSKLKDQFSVYKNKEYNLLLSKAFMEYDKRYYQQHIIDKLSELNKIVIPIGIIIYLILLFS